MEQTTDNIKEYILKQKSKWDYIFHFSEEIDSITDEDVILQIANLVKIKHQELLNKKQPNKTLVEQTKIEPEQPTEEVYRAKYHNEPLRAKDNTKQCFKCKVWKPKESFYTNKVSNDGLQSYCKQCQKTEARKSKINGKNKTETTVKKDKEIAFNKKGKGVFIPTYGTTIKAEEIDKVLKAVSKERTGEGTHSEFICRETGLKQWRANAVLLYLQGMNRIKKDYESVGKLRYVLV